MIKLVTPCKEISHILSGWKASKYGKKKVLYPTEREKNPVKKKNVNVIQIFGLAMMLVCNLERGV